MAQPVRVAVITGGGTGIGAAAAVQFAREGTAVAIVGRRPAPLEETAQRIRSDRGEVLCVPADLADASKPVEIIETVASTWGRVDVLVNNAAAIKHLPLAEASVAEFDEHIAVNVRAPFLLTQAALPYLRRSDSAAVINISSSSGSLAIPGQFMYGTSKAALEYLTRSLAAELAPWGITVNGIAPGPVDTPIHLTWAGDDVQGAYERMKNELPLKRMGTAQELAAWIVWLARPEARWVTGVVIAVDGGQTLPGALSAIVSD